MISDTEPHNNHMLSDILHIPMNVFKYYHEHQEKKYTVFNESQESWISFRIISFLYTVLFFVGQVMRINYLVNDGPSLHGWPLTQHIIYEVTDGSLILTYWMIMYLRRNDKGNTLNARKAVNIDNYRGTSLKVNLQNIFIIGITMQLGYWLLLRVAQGQCEKTLSMNNFTCNPNQDKDGLPIESVVILMLLPMTFCVAFRGTSFSVQLTSWAISVAAVFATSAFVRINQNLPYLLVYAPTSLFLIYENERQNKVIFLVTERLSQLLEENERLADETHANELRHMVGNVAHDLRTPLTSFLNCMDMMGTTLESFHSKSCKADMSTEAVQSNIESMNELLGGLRNASTFMSMAINRCLDFTKSSKGIALSANLETVSLHLALKLPLRVVNDMQSRIGIHVDPLPDDICTHIVTDLQWLQENFLCLLSNAVKYTVSGSVAIQTSVHELSSLQYDGPELDAGVFTSARLLSVTNMPTSAKANHYAALGGSQSVDAWDIRSDDNNNNNAPRNNERTVQITFTQVSIRKIPGGVIFISRQILRNESQKKNISSDSKTPGRFLRFDVLDCGIGLDEETMLTIYHPFRQTHRMNGGVGLGLYSLAKRTEALGGYYGVSTRGDGQQGCRFFFGIPYVPDPLAASLRSKPKPLPTVRSFVRRDKVATTTESFSMDESPSRHTSMVTSGKTHMRALHILLVDDSMSILKMTSMILRKQGHEVETALHGAEALDKLELARFKKVNPFDLVLMDLQMPVMDGMEAMRRIRNGERERRELALKVLSLSASQDLSADANADPTIRIGDHAAGDCIAEAGVPDHQKIIAMSANSDLSSSGAALAAGADKFIAKPFSMQTLNEILGELEN